VDSENSELYIFSANSSQAGGTTANAIYYKKTSLTNIGFAAADQGTPFILSSVDTRINNPTSTKQNLNSTTGLLVLASDEVADFYYHNYLQLASSLAPDITSFSPASGGAGTQVTLTGNRFTGSTAVVFNSTSAVFTVNSNTQITTAVPVGATTGKISVTNAGGTRSSAADFTVLLGAPVIVVSLQAQNAGTLSTTATISCLGQPSKQQLLLAGTTTTINTGWTAPCSPVSISNIDSLPSGPVITNVAAGSITTTGATITFTTNVAGNTQVDYGTTTAYGSQTTLNPALVTSHSQALTGLTAGTLYHFRVRSTDGFANPAVSGDFTFTTLAAGAVTVTFNDLANPDRVLTGQYPTGIINWGTGSSWYLSGPWQLFTTKSISFNGSAQTSGSFSFVAAYRLVSLQAYNGGTGSTTVTLSCPGQTSAQQAVAAGAVATISTGWTAACTPVTISNTNGWNTNFDNLVVN
jgi:hypothetical protein